MKKSIRPPENWQDFETLCKKLFGELWGCSMTIKKNGRLGQPQSGVDIYGKPKNENEYWGIQCKGKNNYLEIKLSEKEIECEIENAKCFEPKLRTFVIATTCTKDVNIEKFIRIKDQECCSQNHFNIILYCWEDLVDLIEEQRDTFNWYVNALQFKDKFDFSINLFSKQKDNILRPKFKKCIKEYILRDPAEFLKPQYDLHNELAAVWRSRKSSTGLFGPKRTNHGWVSIEVIIKNTGSIVMEDWKFWMEFDTGIQKIDDEFTKNIFVIKEASKYRTSWVYEDNNQVLYKPLNNHPLIQKDARSFKCFCIPNYEAESIKLRWYLLARDFNAEGTFEFKVKADYFETSEIYFVATEKEVRTEIIVEDYITST